MHIAQMFVLSQMQHFDKNEEEEDTTTDRRIWQVSAAARNSETSMIDNSEEDIYNSNILEVSFIIIFHNHTNNSSTERWTIVWWVEKRRERESEKLIKKLFRSHNSPTIAIQRRRYVHRWSAIDLTMLPMMRRQHRDCTSPHNAQPSSYMPMIVLTLMHLKLAK